ncbi:MAG: histidine phosphatase family protein [Streptosporangiales bacterium]|nr:histidine phosphatase family protein [Streptosporangiales bacterium]
MTPDRAGTGHGRRLLVLRHAKAESGLGLADVERPLAKRGKKDASAAGRWLRAAGMPIGLVVCSPALRARQTWAAAAAELAESGAGGDVPVRYDDRLYRNTVESLGEVVRETDDEVDSLLLVGHNPSVQQLVATLIADADPVEGFPTCALALVEFTEPWAALAEDAGRLAQFWTPSHGQRGSVSSPAVPRDR